MAARCRHQYKQQVVGFLHGVVAHMCNMLLLLAQLRGCCYPPVYVHADGALLQLPAAGLQLCRWHQAHHTLLLAALIAPAAA